MTRRSQKENLALLSSGLGEQKGREDVAVDETVWHVPKKASTQNKNPTAQIPSKSSRCLESRALKSCLDVLDVLILRIGSGWLAGMVVVLKNVLISRRTVYMLLEPIANWTSNKCRQTWRRGSRPRCDDPFLLEKVSLRATFK